MSRTTWFSFIAAMALCMCLSGLAAAQEITGGIVGSVRDANGAGVPNATVTITDPAKGNLVVRSLTTGSGGEFSAPNLPVSIYSITVEAANFKKAVNTNIKLDVGQRRTVDVTLEAGRVEEVVTVQADPVAVNLTSATNGTIISGDQVRELPTNNRNFIQLITLAPGVSNDLSDQVYVGTTNPAGQANIVSISVNGARSSQNTYTVDGADVTDRGSNITIQAYPSFDSIGEFNVLRSLYPAESGRSGGGQVNIVTKSGTSQFHGSVYEFIRNDAFNANNVEVNSLTNPPLGRDDNGKAKRSPFRYNDYGYTIGGPVYFFNFGENDGGMFRRYNRTFFFWSQEFRKDTRYPTLTSTVPTALQRTGQFTVPICLHVTAGVCDTVQNGSPASPGQLASINPIAQQYLTNIYNKLPLPNLGANTLVFPTFATSKFHQEILKIDHSFNDKLSMYYRFENDTIPTIDPNSLFSSGSGLPGVATTSTDSPGRTHTVSMTYAASSNLIFEGLYTYGYGAILSHNIGLLALVNSPITPPLPFQNQRDRVPTISGAGFSNLSSFGPYDNFSWKGNIGGSATWIKGSHTMKFGAIYSKYRKNENALAGNNEGIYSAFNTPGGTSAVVAPDPDGPGPLPGGNSTDQAWANFLMGTNVSLTQASFDYTANLYQKTFEAYAQDEFKVRKNITFYYGVRYSYFGPPWDKNGRLTAFDPTIWNLSKAPQVTGAGNRVPGTGNFCNGLIVQSDAPAVSFPNCTPTVSPWGKYVMEPQKHDFAPRIGIAWDPFGDGKTSIRSGYGIYHEQVLNGDFEQNIGINPPFQITCAVTGVSLNNPTPGGCAVAAANTAVSIRSVDPHWKTPYMQHWSLDVQRQLTSRTVFSVGYYGSKGTHLIGGFEMNDLPPRFAIGLGSTACAVGASTTPSAPCQVDGAPFYSSAATAILDQIRPFRGYRSIQDVEPRYNSSYHSMQVSATHRFSGASQVQLAYTWSKNLTDAQNDRSTAPQNTYNLELEKARAALDRRHILTVNFNYELPFYKDQKGAAGKILGGWQLSGIGTYQTGLPFSPTVSSFDASGLGLIPALVAGARPNIVNGCNPNEGAPHTVQQWYNVACFVPTPTSPNAAPSVVGNAARNIIEGPPTKRVDLILAKNFTFAERIRVQLRAEAYNVFNITNPRTFSTLTTFTTTTAPVSMGGNGSSTFGRISTFRDPRVMQFAAKVSF